jgi:nucleoside diphosphate kinase
LNTRTWDDSFVLVITPDAFLRGVGSQILQEFCDRGFRPVDSRVVQPGARELDALYEDVIANNGSWGTYRYRCVDALFGLGSSLATVMRENSPGPGLHDRVQRIKGSGPLAEADPQSLRRRFRSVNSILSLVHTSASPAEAELDYTIFFRRDWLTDRAGTRAHLTGVENPVDAHFAAAHLDHPGDSRETRGFTAVRRQLRARLVVHLWEHLSPELHAEVLDAFKTGDHAYLDDQALRDTLCAHLATHVDPQIVAALATSFTPAGEPLAADRLWGALRGAGIGVDPWARAVLSTSQHFAPVEED